VKDAIAFISCVILLSLCLHDRGSQQNLTGQHLIWQSYEDSIENEQAEIKTIYEIT
jgi:hypothetical protein